MSSKTVAHIFTLVHNLCTKYGIQDPSQVFKIDDSGVYVAESTKKRTKVLFIKCARTNCKELTCSNNAQHVTVFPTTNADGKNCNVLFVLLVKHSKYRIISRNTLLTPADFLPSGSLVCYRDPVDVDKQTFNQWAQAFIEERKSIRGKHGSLVLFIGNYTAHVLFEALVLLQDNNVLVIGLPSHTIHRLQPLDYSYFSPFKTRLRNYLSERSVMGDQREKKDVYTVSEFKWKSLSDVC